VLWIAALAGVTAATVLVVLVSHSGNRVRVAPLREEKTSAKPRSSASDDTGADNGWLLTPTRRPADSTRRNGHPRTGGSGEPTGRGGRSAANVRKHEGIHPVRSTSARVHVLPTPQPAPVAVPPRPPASVPSSAAPAVTPVHETEPGRKSDTPQTASTPESDDADIEIRNGKLYKAPDQIDPHGQNVTLRVRADELTIVEIEGVKRSVTILAGEETPITIDAHLAKHLEVELHRRAGVLVLHLDD
jgi:hypothetical protein